MITQENIPYTADEIKAMLKTCEKYNKAREKAREPMDKGYDVLMPEIFPELQEDKDERIRKTIYGWIYTQPSEFFDNGFSKEEMLAWLEKQGEKKPTDEVEPKFKVGDWITNGRYISLVVGVDSRHYQFKDGDAKYIDDIDKKYHLWTIQDAMDGDVLVDEDNNIGIYVGEKDDFWHSCIYLGCDSCLREIGGYHKHNNTKPATKEQRDLLFKEIHDAEYEWDANKKELKKIEPKKLDADKVIEWLKNIIEERVMHFRAYKETRLALPYNSIEDLIDDFKEDFGLC